VKFINLILVNSCFLFVIHSVTSANEKAIPVTLPNTAIPHASMSADNSTEYKIVFLGDSLTEGLGVAKTSAFPHRVEKKIHEDGYKNVKVINSGVSGATSASLKSRIPWVLKSNPQMVVLAIGANDGLRGFSVEEMKKNIQEAVQKIKKENITLILVGMKMPPNYGAEYTKKFENAFLEIATKEKLHFIPFLLEGVAAIKKYNQPDGIHPNEKGYEIIAKHVYHKIIPLLKKEIKNNKNNKEKKAKE